MGQLRVTYRIGLRYPLLPLYSSQRTAVITFPENGTTVEIEPPQEPVSQADESDGVYATMVLRVERQCTDAEGNDTTFANARRLGIPSSAAKALFMMFETLRYSDLQGSAITGRGEIAGYPVLPSEEIQNNVLVRKCEMEWVYEGRSLNKHLFGSVPVITVTNDSWKLVIDRFASGQAIPTHVNFALDAAYFETSDPLRAIIMACAAWETAQRLYLATIAAKRDHAYAVAAKSTNLPKLYEFVRAAKGGPVFHGLPTAPALAAFVDGQRKCIEQLPSWRNKLLHEGKNAIPPGAAGEAVLAVLSAIEWLFA